MAAATCLRPRTKLVLASPTFDLLADYAARAGAAVAPVPLDRHHAHDLDAMLVQADASASLVYICNPNNPTGTLTPRNDLEAFIRKLPATSRVLIDEAYHHYAGASSAYASFIDRPVDDRRVIAPPANFFRPKPGRRARVAIDPLPPHNILVAPPVPSMGHYIRVSLGTPHEMLEFWRVWDLMGPHSTHM